MKELKRRELGEPVYHQWVQYMDSKGIGFCEPELYWVFPNKIVLVEIKLTGGNHGKMQMEGLYKPLLEKIYNRPVVCLLICKYVTDETPGPFFSSPEEFLAAEKSFGTWQHL